MLAIPTPRFKRFLISVLVALISSPALAETITGQASVIDGDTLEIHGQRIRLSGIDAPESSQLCRGDDSLQYRCGARAANELDDHIAGRPVSCEGIGGDQYGRVVAVCSIGGEDIATWLARNGLAFDWPRYSNGKYAGVQKEAERAGRGVWAGSYVVPWAYRACIRNGGRPSGCSDDANSRP
jgi:endonuclease YncB( thermonuclease family)